jgi:tRNA threonylcarbamoyladenosine biosynthesis protein TsaE
MATFISRSPDQTLALGESWGREARRGWLIGLSGELGAGKTQLVKGLARGLGIGERVHSPTFALVHEYEGGRLPLVHLDLFRLESAAQIAQAGLDDYLRDPAGVTVVEWAERWLESAPGRGDTTRPGWVCRRVWIETMSETDRRIVYEDSGT